MLDAVPVAICGGVVEAEVRRAVDDGRSARQPPGRQRCRDGVGQRGHDHIHGAEVDAVLDDQVDGTARDDVAVAPAGAAVPEDAGERHVRVTGQQRCALHPDVAGRAGDGGAQGSHLGHDREVYGPTCILMQSDRMRIALSPFAVPSRRGSAAGRAPCSPPHRPVRDG